MLYLKMELTEKVEPACLPSAQVALGVEVLQRRVIRKDKEGVRYDEVMPPR